MMPEVPSAQAPIVRRGVLPSVLATTLPLLAASVACALTGARNLPIVIETPAVLIAASLLTLPPCRSDPLQTLQRVMALYLICIPINEMHPRFFVLPTPFLEMRVAYSVLPLLLFAGGYGAEWWARRSGTPRVPPTDFATGWLVAGVVITAHMAVLALLLHKVYGYGYEQDLQVLGSVTLYFLVFLTSWGALGRVRLRQALGLILTLFYVMVAVVRG